MVHMQSVQPATYCSALHFPYHSRRSMVSLVQLSSSMHKDSIAQAHDVIKRQRVEEQSMDKGALAYLQDKGAIASASTIGWNGLVADGVNSLLVCHGGSITAGDDGIMLVLLSDKPRAWSKRERLWALAITNKLDSCWA